MSELGVCVQVFQLVGSQGLGFLFEGRLTPIHRTVWGFGDKGSKILHKLWGAEPTSDVCWSKMAGRSLGQEESDRLWFSEGDWEGGGLQCQLERSLKLRG